MKLEVGMYVRLKRNQGIAKIEDYEEYVKRFVLDEVIGDEWGEETCLLDLDDVLKASHNIIDLIEPMDLMFIDISPDDCGGIVVPRIAETLDELERWKEHISNGYWILKDIVTREQIESARYKVGE